MSDFQSQLKGLDALDTQFTNKIIINGDVLPTDLRT